MSQNMNRKHEKHTVTPPSKGGNRPPCYVYSVLGVYYKPFAGFCQFAPLDKPGRMDIIVDVRGRCDKRSAPSSVSNLIRLYSLQKPSLSGVAVFVFQLHNTNRNGIPPDVESKYPVHVCHPLTGL